MAGIAFETTVTNLDSVQARIGELSDIDIADLAFEVGSLLEDQTRVRIADEKAAPDGTPWAPWSESYAATRSAAHSLLVGEKDLLESVQNYSSGAEARVGTNRVYGAIHQFGGGDVGRPTPARPYLGLSPANDKAVAMLLVGRIEEIVG